MSTTELPPQYNPKAVEEKIYRLWEESGFFNPDKLPKDKGPETKAKSYTVVVPPPNVTGSLHLGHALNAVIQDILIRKKRMEGYQTLWLPGTDHAGIATQNVVEKELKKEGLTRHDLGREKLIERIWEWKEKYGDIIFDQFKKLGSSMDWTRARFTLDEGYQKAVEEAFLRYYAKGWIYRAERVINWCPKCQTSLSDLELEYKEVETKLYFIRYPLVEKHKTQSTNYKQNTKHKAQSDFIVVATVRPETMLGDAAIAVNPKDDRYKKLIGEKAILPIQNREIPIVADDAVEKEFGTGAVKVTPSHDLLDAEIAERHNLARHTVINALGKMTVEAGAICEGLKVHECREKVVEELKKQGLLEKEEPYKHNVAICYRCAATIEPIPSLQWFLKMSAKGGSASGGKGLSEMAIQAVTSGKVKFHPERWRKVYLDRLEHEKDWTLSRQIWWGHRIPVWYSTGCEKPVVQPNIKGNWFFVRHGETDFNKVRRVQGQSAGAPLNETGRKQAKDAAEKLQEQKIDLVISSDLERAAETAKIIAQTLDVEVVFDEGLRERNYGVLEGLTREEMEERGLGEIRERLHDHEFVPPQGESPKDVEERVHAALLRHRNHHTHKNVVIVSHGSAIRNLLRKLKNITPVGEPHIDIRNADIIHFAVADECTTCGSDFIEQDPDVLDTWFSSALWPFATLGWPEAGNMKHETCAPQKGSDLERFYPTQVLSTARDIINLWVGRMVFSGMEFMSEPPFQDVIIHATILTKEGKRMSKSLGTGVDPMALIEKYGADALRFGLIWQAMGGQDIHWSEEHVVAGKKFANKLWNIARYILIKTGDDWEKHIKDKERPFHIDEITGTDSYGGPLRTLRDNVNINIENYNFGEALHEIYKVIWHDFADKYIESSKKGNPAEVNRNLAHSLVAILKLLHPFMPFVTEEIWSKLPAWKGKQLLIVEEWPH